MTTIIRPELSTKNKYWVSKHRYYELKHFCLQYKDWKRAYSAIDGTLNRPAELDMIVRTNVISNPTEKYAIMKAFYIERIEMIEDIAKEADPELWTYILKAVTEELSYNYLKTNLNIPCCKDTYYDRYRRFFWLLSKARE